MAGLAKVETEADKDRLSKVSVEVVAALSSLIQCYVITARIARLRGTC
jgi:hypothetical protein